jgi:hypothetical protein
MTLIALLAAGALSIAPAHRECDPVLTSVEPVGGTPTVDPFEPTGYQATLRVVITNQGDACRLGVAARDPSGTTRLISGLDVPYMLARGPQDLPADGNPLVGADLVLGAGQSTEVLLDMTIPRPFFATPGSGDARFDLRLHDRDDADAVLVDAPVSLPVQVVGRAQANLAGTAAVFGASWAVDEIDFQDLEAGEARTVHLQLRTNVPTTITISSANQGLMRHVSRPGAAGVPYSVDLLGASGSLTAPLTRAAPSSSSLAGSNIPITVTIGELSDRWAGAYRDVLTIDVTAQ